MLTNHFGKSQIKSWVKEEYFSSCDKQKLNIPKKAQFSGNYKQLASGWKPVQYIYIGVFSAQCFADFSHIEKSFGVTQNQSQSHVCVHFY